jgi:beta-lactamase regulating signal transducer with metallopeptidase domain
MTEWLVDTLVATSALLLLVLLVRGYVARSFGPSVAYWLWLLPAARLFMPALTKEVAAPAVIPVNDIVRDAMLAAPVQAVASDAALVTASNINWTGIGLSVWLGGAALLFIVQMIRYVALRDELLGDATEIDRIGDISVVESDRIGGPLAFGLFRRYIAVPDHFTRTFSEEERDLALAHELAHHRAGDLYMNLAAFTFLCLQWFNPLAWMAWSAFRFDQEAACDARVLAGTDTGTRQNYGRALARAATSERMPTLAMAMAQNRPHSIIQRLRRLMMKDTSKSRLWTGRAAIFAAAAIALPLTATVVPVFAEDQVSADGEPEKVVKHKAKIIMIKGDHGKMHKIDVSGDKDTPFVRTIEKDGKTIVLRSNKELSEAEVEEMVAEAEESRAEAEAQWGEAKAARGEAEAARGEAEAAKGEAEAARADSEVARAHSMHVVANMDFSSYIPEIDISEIRTNCKKGHPVTTDVSGFDGQNKSRVKIVMCGQGQAKLARMEAIKGLREAREEVKRDKDIPDNVRQSVIDSLEKQIDRMEDLISEEDAPGNEA